MSEWPGLELPFPLESGAMLWVRLPASAVTGGLSERDVERLGDMLNAVAVHDCYRCADGDALRDGEACAYCNAAPATERAS